MGNLIAEFTQKAIEDFSGSYHKKTHLETSNFYFRMLNFFKDPIFCRNRFVRFS